MNRNIARSLRAGSAMIAALALGTTATAQDIVLPGDPAPPAASVPEIAAPSPVAEAPAPAAPTSAKRPTTTRAKARPAPVPAKPAPVRTVTRATAPKPAAVAPVVALPVAAAPVVAPGPIAPTVAAPPPVVAAPAADDGLSRPEATALGLVGLAALASAGLFAAGRTRRRRRMMADDGAVVEFEQPQASAAPLDNPLEPEATVPAPWTPAADGAASPERFVIPSGPVPIGAERDVLLTRMVAAPPDEANPFRSTKGRRRRARMILATRERELAQDARQPFDWRTYTPSTTSHREASEPATVTS